MFLRLPAKFNTRPGYRHGTTVIGRARAGGFDQTAFADVEVIIFDVRRTAR
jgi:hypothetical protein